MPFDNHTVVLLVLRPDAPEPTDELQERHLAYRAELRQRGLLMGGPLDDERLRGLSIWSCEPETARRLNELDPAVQAGRLAVQVMTWMVPTDDKRRLAES